LAALAPADRNEAVNRILAVAMYFRQQEPQNPVPYLMLRALRWGELRARSNGEGIDPGFLQAPAAEIRVALKNAAGAASWRQVLETAESAMGEPCGRGWLDLQRYSIQACQALEFTAAANAMLSELRTLLGDVPNLPEMTLSDDTGAANPQTRAWLAETVLAPPAEEE
jgi:type VI secretion system protein ImpA